MTVEDALVPRKKRWQKQVCMVMWSPGGRPSRHHRAPRDIGWTQETHNRKRLASVCGPVRDKKQGLLASEEGVSVIAEDSIKSSKAEPQGLR
jgi:hypothetical protein